MLLFEQRHVLSVPFFFEVFLGDEAQGRRVDAVAQAGGGRAVVEQVPKVGVGMLAANFGAHHQETRVALLHDVFLYQGPGKTGPARTGFELVRGAEQGLAGNDIDVDAGLVVVPIGVAERPFCTVLSRDLILQVGQSGAQLLIGRNGIHGAF